MSYANYTRGKFHVTEDTNGAHKIISAEDGAPVACCGKEEDAVLLAQAPDLIEVIEELYNWAQLNILFNTKLAPTINAGAWDKARAAVYAARGAATTNPPS